MDSLLPHFSSKYLSLDQHEKTSEESEPKTQNRPLVSSNSLKLMLSFGIWAFSTSLLLLFVVFQNVQLKALSMKLHTYESGFDTEFASARHVVNLQKTRFYGNLHFHKNGSSFLQPEPGEIQYAGPPTPEIDENWYQLINDRYFYLSEEEAFRAWGPSYDGYFDIIEGEKRYVAGLDVLHTLHCVNMFRELLDPEYYKDSPHMTQNHNCMLDHCIDQLRQYLMCYGDLTLVQTMYSAGKQQIYVESDMVHTCRNWDSIHDWIKTRDMMYDAHRDPA